MAHRTSKHSYQLNQTVDSYGSTIASAEYKVSGARHLDVKCGQCGAVRPVLIYNIAKVGGRCRLCGTKEALNAANAVKKAVNEVIKKLDFAKLIEANPKIDVALAAQYARLVTTKQGANYSLGQPLGGMPERPKQDQHIVMNRALALVP